MDKLLIPLLFPALVAAQDLTARNLDFDLLGPEAYRFEPVRSEPVEEPALEAPAPRGSGIFMESGLGLAVGAAAATALVVPLALSALEGETSSLQLAAGGANIAGSAAGIWLGGRWSGRSGHGLAALAGTVVGQVAGAAAGIHLAEAMGGNSLGQPLAFTMSFALPTVLGVLGYNLTDFP